METRIMITIQVEEGTIFGTARASVNQWHDGHMVTNCGVYNDAATVPPLEDGHSVIPWAIAVIRDSGDRMVAKLLEDMAAGKEILLREVSQPHIP